jgi:hypothetical protein
MSETQAETLRRAAKLMRECAETATAGPWKAVAGGWQNETFAAVLGPDGDPSNPETWLMATGRGSASQKADARQAAFMHPGVAKAVAAWLQDAADDPHCTRCADPNALNVARTYLGEENE